MATEVTVDRTDPSKPVLYFERRMPHPATEVWKSITDPNELKHWFPCEVELEPVAGGNISFIFEGEEPEHSRIIEFDPPRALAYEWAGELLRWTIEPDGDCCTLRLSNTIQDPEWLARTAAGWDTCFEDLDATLAGMPTAERPGPDEEKIEHFRRKLLT